MASTSSMVVPVGRGRRRTSEVAAFWILKKAAGGRGGERGVRNGGARWRAALQKRRGRGLGGELGAKKEGSLVVMVVLKVRA